MNFEFETLAVIASTVCIALSLIWLIRPQLMLSMWGIGYSDEVGIVSRRGAALFLGIGVMFFLARHAEPGPSRVALSEGFAMGCVALAMLGVFELVRKRAGFGIVSAVVVELMLAFAFFFHGE